MFRALEDYCISNDTIISIGQFAVLWGMVEEEYFNRCCTNKKLGKICILHQTENLVSYAYEIKKALTEYYQSGIVAVERLSMREKDRMFSTIITSFLCEEEANPNNAIYASICICFRIRNNLFHGEKVFWCLNQQKVIIDACSYFLNELIAEEEVFQIVEEYEVMP